MSLSVAKRREACLRLLRSEFDIEGTIKWVLREYANDPAVERATNKEKLARNVITMGSSGDQQALNMVAFQQALTEHFGDQLRKANNLADTEKGQLKENLTLAEERRQSVELEYRGQVDKNQRLMQANQDLREQLSEVRMDALRKALPESEDEVVVST